MWPVIRLSMLVRLVLLAILAWPASPTLAADEDRVPLTFINGLPFVPVTIGTIHAHMLFDSGGWLGISIPEATARGAGTVVLLQEKARFSDLQGKVYEVPMLIARDIVVGHTVLPTVKGRIHVQWGGAPEGPEAALSRAREAGAIGLAAFENYPVMFDYAARQMTIYAPGKGPKPGDAGWQDLHLGFGKEGPYVILDAAGTKLKFVLDTGASHSLINAERLSAMADRRCSSKGAGQECDPDLLDRVVDDRGNPVGALRVQPVALGGAPFDGILGAPFFAERGVVFDLANHRLLVTPRQTAESGHHDVIR